MTVDKIKTQLDKRPCLVFPLFEEPIYHCIIQLLIAALYLDLTDRQLPDLTQYLIFYFPYLHYITLMRSCKTGTVNKMSKIGIF